MSIAQKSLAIIAVAAVAVAVVFSFVATIQVASAATNGCPHTWSVNLTVGSTGADVMALQQLLNSDSATMVASTGVGSPGMESMYFGGLTKAAVVKFQNKYMSQVLTPVGLTAGTGFFGASSRAQANGLCSGTVPPGPTTPPVSVGTGLMVAAGTQPASSLAPKGASRVPFTSFSLTAGNDGDVTVSSVTVQRTGLGSDAAFNGIILIDQDTGMQLGNSQSFNSNHQTNVGGMFTVPRGTTRHFLVAANMQSSLTAFQGQSPSIAVIAINTTANVSGSLPITGASQTLNDTLVVGTISLATSNAYASNSNQTVNIGDTMRKTSGLRLTAGSAEDVRLRSITWNQTGSVSSTDLANVMTVVNGTSYPTTVSSDGKYYFTSLGAGVVIPKGNQVDVYVSFDVVGGNSNGRSVIFDVDKNTDIFATGETYGYGISPAATSTAVPGSRGTETITSGSPFVYSTQDTIQGASVTTISKDNSVPAQNIAINVQDQPLGGFVVDLKGESVTTQQIIFTIATSSSGGCTTGSCLLTNVRLVDENGLVIAGPYDGVLVSNGATSQTVTMSSSITFPTGRHVYTLKGKVDSQVKNGTVYTASTDPTTWTNVRGNTSGNTISLAGNTNFSMNPMTVKAGALVIGASSSLTSQNIVPGGQQVEMARFAFDAGQSGEDVRISSIPADLVYATGAATDLTSCQIYDGTTSLTTGTNSVNPSGVSAVDKTFTLDNPKTIAKGTVWTASLRCNVSGNATANGTFTWLPGTAGNVVGGFTVTGAVSGTTITATAGSNSGATFTIKTGAFTATAANASITQPSRAPVAAGSAGTTVGYIKFHATNEAVNLTKVGLTLANGLYGSTARGDGGSSNNGQGDVLTVYLYNGATQVGTATFNGSQTATSTFSSVLLAKDADTVFTVKADLAQIGVSASGGIGDLIKVDPLNAEGTGASSGSVVAIQATAGVNGVQLVKSFPTVALGTGACVGNACNGSNQILKVFTVTANASGPVSVYQTKVSVATSTAQGSDFKLFVYDASGNQLSSTAYGASAGQFGVTACALLGTCITNPTMTFTGTIPVQVPAGSTYTFKLLATVTPGSGANNWSVISTVQGDAAVQINLGTAPTYIATSTNNVSSANFVWSDNATTTAATTDVDWFNGFQVPGLSGNGI